VPSSSGGPVLRTVAAAITGGVIAALVALIDGIILIAKRTVTDCPNGHYFPEGTTNFNCYAHPRLAEGVAISALALSIGAVLLIVGVASLAVLRRCGGPSPAE